MKLLEKNKSKRIKSKLNRSLEKSYKARESDIYSIHNTWKLLQNSKQNKYDEFYNVCLYSSIVGRDIALLWDKFTLTESNTDKNLYGRLLCMTIIEFLDDINGLLGKSLRLELGRNGMNEYTSDLNDINKRFSKVKKQYNKELRNIRNNYSAHKTKKAIDLMDFTAKENFENLHEISAEVSMTNNELTKLTTRIVLKITDEIQANVHNLK